MAYIGIGYTGSDQEYLKRIVEQHRSWLKGDRQPKLFGKSFLILYDSNTAREFAKKCIESAQKNTIVIYPMGNPLNS